jgi:hypothetical protein
MQHHTVNFKTYSYLLFPTYHDKIGENEVL